MISRLWRRVLDQKMAAAGLTDVSWAPLVHLDEAGRDLSQKELAARVGLDSSTLVRLLDRLEANAYLERRPDARDRRTKRLFLTAAGKEAARTIRRQLQVIEAEILADFSDEELATVLSVLGRLRQRLEGLASPVDIQS